MGDGVRSHGRALARNGAVTMINDNIKRRALHDAHGRDGAGRQRGRAAPGRAVRGRAAPGRADRTTSTARLALHARAALGGRSMRSSGTGRCVSRTSRPSCPRDRPSSGSSSRSTGASPPATGAVGALISGGSHGLHMIRARVTSATPRRRTLKMEFNRAPRCSRSPLRDRRAAPAGSPADHHLGHHQGAAGGRPSRPDLSCSPRPAARPCSWRPPWARRRGLRRSRRRGHVTLLGAQTASAQSPRPAGGRWPASAPSRAPRARAPCCRCSPTRTTTAGSGPRCACRPRPRRPDPPAHRMDQRRRDMRRPRRGTSVDIGRAG